MSPEVTSKIKYAGRDCNPGANRPLLKETATIQLPQSVPGRNASPVLPRETKTLDFM